MDIDVEPAPKKELPKGVTRKEKKEDASPAPTVAPETVMQRISHPEEGEPPSTEAVLEARTTDAMDVDGNGSKPLSAASHRSDPSIGTKRAADSSHKPRLPPMERTSTESGPSKKPLTAPNGRPKESKVLKKAEKELEALRKRRQQNNSLFIRK